jgi:hypothetical protein
MGPEDDAQMRAQALTDAWADVGPQMMDVATQTGLVRPGPGGTILIQGVSEPVPFPPPEAVLRAGEAAAAAQQQVDAIKAERGLQSIPDEQVIQNVPSLAGLMQNARRAIQNYEQMRAAQTDAYNAIQRAAVAGGMQLQGR